MAQRKNMVFNAELDELLPDLMLEQVAMGRKGDIGFKDEAYMAVANAMTVASRLENNSVKARSETDARI
ncbi:hypothetical protein AAC387_Pa01g1292 [Persea americana]